ncbi:hypothetical protein ACFC1R_25805 [Kitasatospora sp. NPDC056138]|uniref:hypothetical protein n=1 Tax=Kitasatospora sp. NPDC056138 TaxID=3345724 RepID=UPI0035DB2958
MSPTHEVTRRLLLSADVKGYGSGDERSHLTIQRDLIRVFDEAADATGLDRSVWNRQPGGDGELAVMPAEISEARVVDDYVAELQAALERHNDGRYAERWLRMRLAVHFGTAIPADNGFAGHGIVLVSRLVDSEPPRRALELAPQACLAVILSDQVYTDTVLQRHTKLSPKEFREVRVKKKERDVIAWLRVPGVDVHALALDPAGKPGPNSGSDSDHGPAGPAPAAAPASTTPSDPTASPAAAPAVTPTASPAVPAPTPAAAPAGQGQSMRVVVHGEVRAPGSVFGINNGTVNTSGTF